MFTLESLRNALLIDISLDSLNLVERLTSWSFSGV